MGWVSVKERLPSAYKDVLIKRQDGSQRVGRLNSAGCWELASYQKCRHQYMASDVTYWYEISEQDDGEARPEGSGS